MARACHALAYLLTAWAAGPCIMRGQRGTLGAWRSQIQRSRRSTDSRQQSGPGAFGVHDASGTHNMVVACLSSQQRSLLQWTLPSAQRFWHCRRARSLI